MKKFRLKVIKDDSWNLPFYETFVWKDISDVKNNASLEGYTVLWTDRDIKEISNTFSFIINKKISKKQVLSFFENLWDYIDSWYNIKQSLESISRFTMKWYYSKFLEDMYISVESWINLYESINNSKYKKFFTYNQLEMIKVWEQTNTLPKIFESLVQEMELEKEDILASLNFAKLYMAGRSINEVAWWNFFAMSTFPIRLSTSSRD